MVTYSKLPTHNDPYYRAEYKNQAYPNNAGSLSKSIGSDPALRATYERLYGGGGPINLPSIRPQGPAPQAAPEPAMPDIPPELMRQIMASLAQRGFSTAKGKPKLASKMAGDQWKSLVDAKAQEAYAVRMREVFNQRAGSSWPGMEAEPPYNPKLLDPEYVRRLYEV